MIQSNGAAASPSGKALNILLTSVGRRTYLVDYFRAALKGRGAVHASNSVMTLAMSTADHAVLTPLIYEDDYIETLLRYCQEWQIGALLPLLDIDLPVLARNRGRFDEIGVVLVVSSVEATRICNDKWKTYDFLRRCGIDGPRTFLGLSDTRDALEKGEVSFPLVVKPRWGLGSIGVYFAENGEELEAFFRKARTEIGRTYLKYESKEDESRSVLVQEQLGGEEYGLDVLNDLQGEFLACIPKRKLAMRAGETDAAVIVDDPDLTELGMRLSSSMKHVGNLDVDCFRTSTGVAVLELNCRFGGQYPFSHLAGADFPRALVALLLGQPVDAAWLRARPGTIGYKDIRPVVSPEAIAMSGL